MGRTGNNMFQYSVGRIVAEKKKYGLSFVNPMDSTIFSMFPNTNETIDGTTIRNDELIVGYDGQSVQDIDMDAVCHHAGGVLLQGYFQKHNIYLEHREQIKKWFLYDTSILNNKQNQYDVVIHIRLTDYVSSNHYIHPDKLYALYKSLDVGSALVITDDRDSPLLDIFRKDSTVDLEHSSVLQDFHYLSNCKRLIMSQSSFSWWASFLGNQESVYVPYLGTESDYWKYNPLKNDIDLIPDYSKYIKVIV